MIDSNGFVTLGSDESQSPDQVIPSNTPGRVLIVYPRGSNTILAWIGNTYDSWKLKVLQKNEESGFTHWIQLSNGDLVNPTDRDNAPACKIVGYK